MAANIDLEWSPDYAAAMLLPGADYKALAEMAKKIREAILSGKLEADRREPAGVFRKDTPFDLVGLLSHRQWYVRPKDVIAWALENAIDVPDEYRQWHQSLTKPKPKARAGGPREKTLYAVIAAMAKTLGYTPGMTTKAGQGKLKAIKVNTSLTEKTIREVIEKALQQADDE